MNTNEDLVKIKSVSLRSYLLRGQIIFGLGLLLVCTLGFIFNDMYLTKKSIQEISKSTSQLIIAGIEPTLIFNDKKEAIKTLSQLSQHPYFKSAIVRDKTGNIFAEYNVSNKPIDPADYIFIYPIKSNDENLGSLQMIMEEEFEYLPFSTYLLVIIPVLLGFFVVAFFLSNWTTQHIKTQITALLNTMAIVRTKSNYNLKEIRKELRNPLHAEKLQIIEINRLNEEFNSMLNLIQKNREEIEQINKDLEYKVEERTSELKQAQDTLIQTSRLSALGEMSAGLSHEIMNPLAILMARVELLRRSKVIIENQDPKVNVGLEAIEKNAIRISKIITGLKSFSRDGSIDPFETANLKTIIMDAKELCQARFKAHSTELIIKDIDPTLDINCRATQIGQVILNLLNNAFDAIQSLEDKWVEIEVLVDEEIIHINITDSGPGIPAEIREKLMQPFFTTKGVGKGTGLGLSISRKIITQHNGILSIDEHNSHTRFIITLPIQNSEVETQSA